MTPRSYTVTEAWGWGSPSGESYSKDNRAMEEDEAAVLKWHSGS